MTDHIDSPEECKYTAIRQGYTFLIGLFVLIIAFSSSLTSCFEETFESNVSVDFTTSLDTLTFDTVFTTIGSATRSIVVSNPTDQNINISSIRLASGRLSMFRLNVDGTPGMEATEIPILARDSLHLFLEVTVDPDQPVSVSPFIIEEELIVESGGRQKVVSLQAWGQNANYFPSKDAQGQLISLNCNNGNVVWDDPKPYVIFGLLFIDSCDLVIPAGTQIFVHGGLARQEETIFNDGGLFFLKDGRLTSQGTPDQPVVFQGDRLESAFDDVRGQWSGIRFLPESQGHRLDHTVIRNSTVGLRLDSASSADLNGVIIANTSNIGLIAIHSSIRADNTLIHSTGPQSIAMVYGGSYRFRHCTIANYENQSTAIFMDNFTCLNEACSAVDVNPLEVVFQNSIIMGSNADELDINDASEGMDPEIFSLTFDHTLIRVDEAKQFYPESSCLNCLEHQGEPVFIDEVIDDYRLDTMSVATNQGISIPGLTTDILGISRDRESPDLGCFELVDQ